jgi:hypothetical protein
MRPADFAVMTTTVLPNVRHDLATPADQHPMMAPRPVRVVHRGDVLAQPAISADTAPSPALDAWLAAAEHVRSLPAKKPRPPSRKPGGSGPVSPGR